MRRLKKNVHRLLLLALVLQLGFGLSSCDDASDLIDLALNEPERRPIDVSRMGVNNFFVDPQFGTISEQFLEIRDTLKLNFIRALFAWTNEVQPSPNQAAFYGFYDAIAQAIPPGVDVIVVLVHSPNWVANLSPQEARRAFVNQWVEPTVSRYANVPGIIGWEVWNEPDLTLFPSDAVMGLEDPANYMDLLTRASLSIRRADPGSLIILAATQAINQDFPNRVRYNEDMRDLGAEALVDIWNVHYYSKNFETVITNNGVADFLNGINKIIWITESGEQGPNNQLGYVEQVWPFLRDEIPGIDRIYYYQFGETTPLDQNFGLRTTDPAFPVSDLYVHLRDER